jgi:glutamine synthetase
VADGVLELCALRELVESGQVDNVVVTVPDLTGRLQGSRLAADLFLRNVLDGGLSACTYLLASDVEMVTRDGYRISPWETGFGDLLLRPDTSTLRRLPWEPRTALVISDATWPDGRAVDIAPRTILQRQLERLADRGLHAVAATELEFRVFHEPFRQAWDGDYRDLSPATAFNVDYALGGLGPLDPLAAELRETMRRLGVPFETARGECAPGQYEITFRYGPALAMCDGHLLYKQAAKAVAARHDMSLSFMAKFDEAEGNSGHVHLSLLDAQGEPRFPGDETGDRGGMSTLMAQFVAGQLACMPELTLLFAPTINSYKRLRPGSFAPTGIAWGRDNRTCPIRVVGAGPSLRFEHRVPGADVNPYLVLAGIIAAGLHGIDEQLELEPAATGNVFSQQRPRLPLTLEEALGRWSSSAPARQAFGADVVTHLAAAAAAELDAFGASVTDWERRRYFERI